MYFVLIFLWLFPPNWPPLNIIHDYSRCYAIKSTSRAFPRASHIPLYTLWCTYDWHQWRSRRRRLFPLHSFVVRRYPVYSVYEYDTEWFTKYIHPFFFDNAVIQNLIFRIINRVLIDYIFKFLQMFEPYWRSVLWRYKFLFLKGQPSFYSVNCLADNFSENIDI